MCHRLLCLDYAGTCATCGANDQATNTISLVFRRLAAACHLEHHTMNSRIQLEPATSISLETFLAENDLYLTVKQRGWGGWRATCVGLRIDDDGSWDPVIGRGVTPGDAIGDFAHQLCGAALRVKTGPGIFTSLDFSDTLVDYIP
jgi:hypothetical protein